MIDKPNNTIRILGWIIVIIIFAASYFKINHWPGSGVLLILGPFLLLCLYLPLWLTQAWKEKEERFFVIFQYVYLSIFITWQVIKFQHWPGGAILGNILYWGCLIVLVPVSLVKLYRFGKSSVFKFNNLILLFYLIASMQTNLIRSSETNVGAGSIALSSRKAEDSYEKIKLKSDHLYKAFEQLKIKEQNEYYTRSQLLKIYTDSIEKYLHDFKTNLISQIENRNDVNFDTLSIAGVWNKVETKTSTRIIVGDDPAKPNKGRFSGSELKSVVETYRDSVSKYCDNDNRAFISSGINLNTDETKDEEGENQSWVITNFYGVPAITILITVTNLEYEIKNAETLVLTDLLNNALKDSKDNLAAKIADLGYKLENEKKKREIESLQKEKEVSQLKIDGKNAEIADRDKAIVWFVIVLFGFGVMTFFIIRSNIIRKRINQQLQKQKEEIEHQKHVIEDKQKEIIDSIQYARRIQNSLLPNEKQMEKIIDRLSK
jgi:hypothetical protein